MIVTTTRITIEPENRKEFFQTISPLIGQLSNAKGCVSCRLYIEVGDDNTCILIEEWETRADCDKQLQSDDFTVLLGAIEVLSNLAQVEFKLLSQTAGIEAISAVRKCIRV